VIDGNLYTAGPGIGSYEAMFRVVEHAFGLKAAQFAEVPIEYDPRPLYGMGISAEADPVLLERFEAFMQPLIKDYHGGSVAAYEAQERRSSGQFRCRSAYSFEIIATISDAGLVAGLSQVAQPYPVQGFPERAPALASHVLPLRAGSCPKSSTSCRLLDELADTLCHSAVSVELTPNVGS